LRSFAPTATNDFTLIIAFDDNPPGGDDIYIVEIDFAVEDGRDAIRKKKASRKLVFKPRKPLAKKSRAAKVN
jgi:hypothetical protein